MVSIIVPAYNAERYLAECVESIFSQSMADWELLLIDDGSTDSTGAMCDTFAAGDDRIRTIHGPNRGVSEARNTGLSNARGQYIAFLDADDVMDPRFLEVTLALLSSTDADMAATGFSRLDGQARYMAVKSPGAHVEISARDALRHALYQTTCPGTTRILDCSPWGKLYKASLWEGMRFRKDIRYEDLDIFYRVWEKARNIAFIPAAMIGYRQHEGSYLHTFTTGRADVLDVTDRIVSYYQESDRDDQLKKAAETRCFAAHCNILLLMLTNYRKAHRQKTWRPIIERCLNTIRSTRRQVLTDREARLKDRLGALLAYLAG